MRRLALLVPLLAACGCAASMPRLTEPQVRAATARWPDADAQSLERGRHLLMSRCSACHVPPAPAELSEQKWRSALREMAGRAHLTPEDVEAVLRYALVARQSQPVR